MVLANFKLMHCPAHGIHVNVPRTRYNFRWSIETPIRGVDRNSGAEECEARTDEYSHRICKKPAGV